MVAPLPLLPRVPASRVMRFVCFVGVWLCRCLSVGVVLEVLVCSCVYVSWVRLVFYSGPGCLCCCFVLLLVGPWYLYHAVDVYFRWIPELDVCDVFRYLSVVVCIGRLSKAPRWSPSVCIGLAVVAPLWIPLACPVLPEFQ
jgi:hypothetical protein